MRARLLSWLRAGAVVPEVSAACPPGTTATLLPATSASGSCSLSASLSWSRLLCGSWSSGGSSKMAFTAGSWSSWPSRNCVVLLAQVSQRSIGVGHWRTSRVLRCRPHSPWPMLWHTPEASGLVMSCLRSKTYEEALEIPEELRQGVEPEATVSRLQNTPSKPASLCNTSMETQVSGTSWQEGGDVEDPFPLATCDLHLSAVDVGPLPELLVGFLNVVECGDVIVHLACHHARALTAIGIGLLPGRGGGASTSSRPRPDRTESETLHYQLLELV